MFLHPHEYGFDPVSPGGRDYSEEELLALQKRDFETRMFMSNATAMGDCVWLRTHFSDNHVHQTVFNVVRDLFKASYATKNYTAAKSSLAEMLTMCIETDKANYYTFATTMASALSEMGGNMEFEITNAILEDENDLELARMKVCLMMHIIFKKVQIYNFVADGSNIYRLVHCSTSVSKENQSIKVLPWFSFLLQILLTVYVFVQNVVELIEFTAVESEDPGAMDNSTRTLEAFRLLTAGASKSGGDSDDDDSRGIWMNIPLAVVTLIYSSMIAYPSVVQYSDAFIVYNRRNVYQVLDFIINTVLPFPLLFSGFVVSDMVDTHVYITLA